MAGAVLANVPLAHTDHMTKPSNHGRTGRSKGRRTGVVPPAPLARVQGAWAQVPFSPPDPRPRL